MESIVAQDFMTVSPAASQAVKDLMTGRNLTGFALRIFVAGKSCSGYQFGMSLDNEPAENDLSFESDGIRILVDKASQEYVKGAKLDFIDDERGKGFLVDNPSLSCSCGDDSCCSSESGGCC